jgi:DHA1 family bicyclomycin/chloramphenicol resistance-like MFS transporter
MIVLAVILMDLLTGMEFDLFVPSFPELQSHFALTPFAVEALLSVNFIGYCLSLFCVGSLADRYGRKPIILGGLLIFVIGSVLCVSAEVYPLLLMGRFLQGVGIAAPAILSFLVIADAYPLKRQQFFMSMLNGAMNISVAAAPVVGSYIALYFQWRGNFALLLILSLMVLLMSVLFVPKYKLPEHKEPISLRGYLPLFRSKPLMLLMLNIVLMFLPYWIFVGMSPLLYMKNLGVSLNHFGYYQGVLALIFALGSILFGLIMHRYTQKKMLEAAGMIYLLSLASLLWVLFLHGHSPLWITLGFLPFIVSQVIPGNLLGPLCLNFIPQAKAKVSAVLQGSRLIFASLGLQIAGYFYQGNFMLLGTILAVLIAMVAITHLFVLRNHALMMFSQAGNEIKIPQC